MVKFAYDVCPAGESITARPAKSAWANSVHHLPEIEAFWDAPLPSTARNDEGARIRTLRCAAAFLRSPVRRRAEAVARQSAADAVLRAARTGAPGDVAAASLHLERYLVLERGRGG